MGEKLRPKDIEVLIVHRPRYNDWSWPKGKNEGGEPIVTAAIREVEEETGVAVVLGQPLTTQRYRLGSGHTKEVHYWVGRGITSGPAVRARKPVERASRREIDETRWVSPQRAEQLLSRRGDRRLLHETMALAAEGTLVTVPFLLVRHAKAVARSSWEGREADRPLTRLGVRQSVDVMDLLAAFGVETLIASPWMRCMSTVGPYVTATGAQLHT
ncbi:MAG: hypothetical protein CSA82_03360, partial [Actinobacteria bacterium]